jgi:hypothetical protein
MLFFSSVEFPKAMTPAMLTQKLNFLKILIFSSEYAFAMIDTPQATY